MQQITMNNNESDSKQGAASRGERRLPAVATMPWILPVVVWFAVVCWRPLIAGFYHDDWAVLQPLFPGDAFKLFADQASRPVYAAIVILARLVIPMNPFYYQGLLAVLMAFSALAIGLFAKRLVNCIDADERVASWSGAFAASIWLAIPWNLGVSVWPTTFPAQFSVIGFCIVGAIVLGNDSIQVKMARALPVFLAISLISELFWLSFIPLLFVLISIGVGSRDLRKHKEIIALFVGFSAVQVLLGALNRILVFLGFGINRSFNSSFLDTAWQSFRLLRAEFTKAVVSPTAFWCLVIIAMSGLIAGGLLHPKRRVIVGALVGIGLGCLISIVLFALAGYGIESIGVFSRTMVVISVWLSLIPALIVAVAAKFGPWVKCSFNSVLIFLLLILALSSVHNVQAWGRSWEFQKALLNSIPVDQLTKAAANDSFILVDADKPENSVEGFEGFWDLSGALFTQYPALIGHFASTRSRQFATIVDPDRKQTTWDGNQIVQSWCNAPDVPLWKLAAPGQVYLWNYSNRKLTLIDNPTRIGCENAH